LTGLEKHWAEEEAKAEEIGREYLAEFAALPESR
jgi:hypothetical protein